MLRTRQVAGDVPTETIRVSPRTRYNALSDTAIPTLDPRFIEPFLAEPMIVDEATFSRAPRIVATQEHRVLLSRGDRAYARAQNAGDLKVTTAGANARFRVFRNATPLKDPVTGFGIEW